MRSPLIGTVLAATLILALFAASHYLSRRGEKGPDGLDRSAHHLHYRA